MPDDVVIRLEVAAPGAVPALVVAESIEAVNRALLAIAQSELDELRQAGLLRPDQWQRATDRLRRDHPDALMLSEAHTGSVVLIGLIAGLSYWILDKTLGETLTAAWTDSDLHRRILTTLKRRWSKGATPVASAVAEEMAKGDELLATKHQVEVYEDVDGQGRSQINVKVALRPDEDYPVPRGALPLPSNDGPSADLEELVRKARMAEESLRQGQGYREQLRPQSLD